MNREILFRGKRTDNGEWVEGSLHIEWGETDKSGNRSLDYRILGTRGECTYVDPSTVGQYTGLKDKNGKRIFEGDVCQMKIGGGAPEPSPMLISIKNASVGFEPIFPDKCMPEDRKWESFWRNDEKTMWSYKYFEIIQHTR